MYCPILLNVVLLFKCMLWSYAARLCAVSQTYPLACKYCWLSQTLPTNYPNPSSHIKSSVKTSESVHVVLVQSPVPRISPSWSLCRDSTSAGGNQRLGSGSGFGNALPGLEKLTHYSRQDKPTNIISSKNCATHYFPLMRKGCPGTSLHTR